MFYPEAPADLERDLDTMLNRVPSQEELRGLRAVVVPHAGYPYSGFTAAHAFALLRGLQYDCVIAVGPSHREYFNGISIYPGEGYETPLGVVPVNDEVRSLLLAEGGAMMESDLGHRSEHCIEVQLPFLQRTLGGFSFVPVIMGDQKRGMCEQLASALAHIARTRNVLLIASSDLSHYHPYNEAVVLDERVIRTVEQSSWTTFIDKFEDESFEACGGGPIASVLGAAACIGADRPKVLHYSTSGDVTGDMTAVVGYLSAAIGTRPGQAEVASPQ